jgi:hypothetical protein
LDPVRETAEGVSKFQTASSEKKIDRQKFVVVVVHCCGWVLKKDHAKFALRNGVASRTAVSLGVKEVLGGQRKIFESSTLPAKIRWREDD